MASDHFSAPASWLCQLYAQACNLGVLFIQGTSNIDICKTWLRLLIIIIIIIIIINEW
jgi:hypothetical protein